MGKGILIKLPGTVGIGVGERALGGSRAQPQMTELAAGYGQAVADLPQALGLSELTEEHSDELVPRGEALAMTFCSTFTDKPQERDPGQDLKYLAKPNWWETSFELLRSIWCALTILLRGVSLLLLSLKTYFGQV